METPNSGSDDSIVSLRVEGVGPPPETLSMTEIKLPEFVTVQFSTTGLPKPDESFLTLPSQPLEKTQPDTLNIAQTQFMYRKDRKIQPINVDWMLHLEPKDKKFEGTFTLENKTNLFCLFKIFAATDTEYVADPGFGHIAPESSMTIKLRTVANCSNFEELLNDRFVVSVMPIRWDCTDLGDQNIFWRRYGSGFHYFPINGVLLKEQKPSLLADINRTHVAVVLMSLVLVFLIALVLELFKSRFPNF